MDHPPALPERNEIIVYQPDETIRLEVRLENETVWLTQSQMAELFSVKVNTINYHIKNILDDEELPAESTIRFFRIVRLEGERWVERSVEFYSLDMIISVGYRVNSKRGIRFRQWATGVLKDYLLRGYAVNDRLDRLETKVARHDEQIGWECFGSRRFHPISVFLKST